MSDAVRCVERLERLNRFGQSSRVLCGEVPVTVVQPDSDRLYGKRRADENVEIVITVHVGNANGDGLVTGFKRDVTRRLSGNRKLEAIRVTARVLCDVVGNGHVGLAVGVEIGDNRGPAKRPAGVSKPELRTIGVD